MKIAGILLILAALIGGGIILSDTIPGWMRNRDYLTRARAEAAVKQQKLESLGPTANESQIRNAMSSAEHAVSSIRSAEDGIVRRRNETLLFGGGALAVLALGAA
ncbi:MAG: hypothetical protein JWP01_2480 [Myxococcales bacterium]|nr:hypothetical protein [Myxococcales bacterium]